jgi:hypothetical protein
MGDEIVYRAGLTLEVSAPQPCTLRLLRDGQEISRWVNESHATHVVPAGDTGVFRVEAHLPRPRPRAWIFSNPIYVRAGGD